MLRVDLAELKAAIAEIESRSSDAQVSVDIQDRKLIISTEDREKNTVTAVLYGDGNLGAQITVTHRLMFMKDKKRL